MEYRKGVDAGCRIHTFLTYTTLAWSGWTIVCFTIERVLIVWVPLKHRSWCTLKSVVISWVVIMVAVSTFHAPLLFKRTTPYPLDGDLCGYNDKYSSILPWIDLFVASGVPILIIFISNILIIIKLARRRYASHETIPRVASSNDSIRNISSITIMLLVLSFVFLITTLPLTIYFLIYNAYDITTGEIDLIKICLNALVYTNNSINFLLYCVTGRKFRKTLIRMFQQRKPRQNATRQLELPKTYTKSDQNRNPSHVTESTHL